ncbi:MAG: TRAP transporter permease [Eubacteriales bacterium]|nr:TRAP transporter permease [Christensenellaceae bacterium]MEA5065394.1 TRAP transporter permease [Eubacteriales bacterium]
MNEGAKKPDDLKKAGLQPEQELDFDEVMAKYDRESATRLFVGSRKLLVSALCVLFSLVQLYAAFTAKIPATQLRPLHLGFVLMLAFIYYPAAKGMRKSTGRIPWYDIALALAAFGCCLYIAVQHVELAMRISKKFDPAIDPAGYRLFLFDMAVGGLLILLLAEACRRVVGYPILIIATLFMVYTFAGRSMPGFLAHRGFGLTRVISYLVYTTEGIMGTPLGASATFIFLFVLFGAFLETTNVGEFFIEMANSIAGGRRGGPAKVAVLSSALFGTVSGSSVANTVGTGSFTIPMMKKLGYRPEFAGAVEAAASTGGQIMPPVMGAAAFLMAESVGISYTEVAKAAIIPALLYFAGIWIIVDLEARKYGLKGLPKDQMPVFSKIFRDRGYLVIPLVVIIYFMTAGFTPVYSALVGTAAAAFCGMLRRIQVFAQAKKQAAADANAGQSLAGAFKQTGIDILNSLAGGGRGVIGVAIACGMAGIIVGTITLTGLGLKMGNGLIDIAGGSQILTLMLTMVASIILGMGVPTTANYLITSTIMAPAVMKVMGCHMLTAHMFAFYFGIVADITPPVALAAMAGSAIAKSKPMRTGFNASKLAIAAFLVPYMFVYNEKMLMIGAEWWNILQMAVTALIGMMGVGVALEGYFTRRANWVQRLMFLAAGLMLIDPGLVTDLIGVGLFAVAALWQWLENKRLGGRLEPSFNYYDGMSAGKKLTAFLADPFVMIGRLIKGERGAAA